MNRGEVWWVEDPEGRRPHLILMRDAALPALNTVITAPATRTVRGIPTEVPLAQEDGMPDVCVLSLDNVTAIPKVFFRERICELSAKRMREACEALRYATGCD